MNQIQIITDAGSDIVDCSRTDLTVLPMTIRFGDEEYLDGVNLTHRQFYEKMIETQVLPTTSQPSPYAFEAAIRKIHEQGDIALIITISSKLSGTWQSANIAAAETGGEVYRRQLKRCRRGKGHRGICIAHEGCRHRYPHHRRDPEP